MIGKLGARVDYKNKNERSFVNVKNIIGKHWEV